MDTLEKPASMPESSDERLLDILRRLGPLGISQLTSEFGVTPTAIRQRLARLTAQGLIERVSEARSSGQTGGDKSLRGRPSFRYRLSRQGERACGNNFADLALVLWQEIRAIADPNVKRGLLQRLARGLADTFRSQVRGDNLGEKVQRIAELLAERNIPFVAETSSPQNPQSPLPVLTALACPYPELAEQDRGICAVEQMMFTELLGSKVRLSECRLDGDRCCRFQTS